VSPRVRTVLFDLDGTLLDHRGSVTTALHQWLPTLGVDASAEVIDAWFTAEARHFPAWRRGEISFAEQRRRRLRDVLPLLDHTVDDDDELDRVFDGYLRHYESAWTLFEDVEPMLGELAIHGVGLAVLSNGLVAQQSAKLEKVGLTGRVGPLFTAEGLGVAKPDPQAFRRVCAELGIARDSVLHVGDLYEVDVVAARTAGLAAVHLDRNDEGPREERRRITTLRDLPALVRA
jgi:putative hydrolase of the HAD superfamily